MKYRSKVLVAVSITSSMFCQQPLFAQVAVGLAAGHMAAQQKQKAATAKSMGEATDAMNRFAESQKREIEKHILKNGNQLLKLPGSMGATPAKGGRVNPALAGKEATQYFEQAKQKEKAGKLADATLLYRQALMLRYSVWGAKDPGILTIAKKIGELTMKQGKYSESIESYKLCLQLGISTYGVGSYEMCPTLEGLGDAYMAQKQYRDAVSNYRQVYTLRERKLGDETEDTIRALRKYSESLIEDQQYAVAEALIKQHILPMKDTAVNTADMKLCMVAYASLLRKTDRASEADSIEASAGGTEAAPEASANPGKTADTKEVTPLKSDAP